MKKFYKLKKWLTIDEAAHRLSIELGADVTKADIFQLASDEQLRISVNFPHDWDGKICHVTTDLELASKFKEITGLEGEVVKIYEYEKCNSDEFIKVHPELYLLKAGVYEVKLIGNSKVDIENAFKFERNLKLTPVYNLAGFYVFTNNGIVIERQTIVDDIPYIELEGLERANKYEKFHYPCSGIKEIDGAFFVIQTEHLNQFLASLDSDVDSNSKLDLDNAMYLLGEVLQIVGTRAKKWTQSEIIDKILERRQNENFSTKGLKQRMIEEYFANANKRLKP